MKLKSLILCGVLALSCAFLFSVKADAISDMRPEVLSSKTTLPEEGQFNVIAEPFNWTKDVTRVMINVGEEVSSSDLQINQFTVYAEHYSDQGKRNDTNGNRRILKAYTVDEEGNEVDSSNYVVLNLEYGKDVQAAHLGSASYASYYSALIPKYQVTYNGTKFTQHDTVNLVLDEFEVDKRSKNGLTVGFGFFKPEDTENKHPLIIYFHGMGEGGANNNNCLGCQMFAYPECAFAEKNIQDIMGGGAYVLLPQAQEQWPTNGFAAESGYLPVVEDLIDEIIEKNPGIDTNRIYVGGLSMGGFMCSRCILSRPGFYAAAFPCSQAYSFTDQDGQKLKEMPIWISCSLADGLCSPNGYTVASYQKLVNAGSKVAKCVAMERQNNNPKSMFRFYSSDNDLFKDYGDNSHIKTDGSLYGLPYITYEAVHEGHENTRTGDFVWENGVWGGHDGGWIPVFANGEFYNDEDGKICIGKDDENYQKVSIMEWAAAQSLVSDFEVDDSAVKKEYSTGEPFDATGLVVKATGKDGSEFNLEGYTVEADTSNEGTVTVTVAYAGIKKTFDITVKAGTTEPTQNADPNAQNQQPVNNNPAPVVAQPVAETPAAAAVAKIKGIKVKKSGKKAIVTWKKDANADRYEVWCSLKKNFKKSVKKIKVKAAKATVKSLKKGKTYYFKVRALKGSTKGAFSAVKKIKI